MKISTTASFKRVFAMLVICFCSTAVSVNVLAQDAADESFHLGEIKCWDLTGVAEEQRAPTMLMVFGYVAGVKEMPTHKGSDISTTLERAGRLCVANPDMYVASAIERVIEE